MIKKWMFLFVAITVSGCVTTGSGPGNIKTDADAGRVSATSSDDDLKRQFETIRVVQMPYDAAWEQITKMLPTVVEPSLPGKNAASSKFQTFDRATGVIKMQDFKYVGYKLPGAPNKAVMCKVTLNPSHNAITIRLIPDGPNTIVFIDPKFEQMLQDEKWVSESFSGRVDALGVVSGHTSGGYQQSSAIYDQCVSNGAIENLIFKSFPEKKPISPVKSLSMGSFHQFYKTKFYWQAFQNSLPDVSAPHFLAKQALDVASATKHMRSGWKEDAATKKDGWETDSIVKLGISYAMGYGVPKDQAVAAKWFRKKSSANYVAQYNLGMLSLKGEGVPKDEVAAAEWFQTASQQANDTYTMAKNNLGVMYAKGVGVQKDNAKAVKLFQEIIDLQKRKIHICNVKTIRNLGYMHENGLGVPKSENKAYGYYFAAARLGDIEAQKSKDLIQEKLSFDQVYSILSLPEFQMADCSPTWSGGWHEMP